VVARAGYKKHLQPSTFYENSPTNYHAVSKVLARAGFKPTSFASVLLRVKPMSFP